MIEHAGIHTLVTPVIDLSISATRYVVVLLFVGIPCPVFVIAKIIQVEGEYIILNAIT